MGVDQSKTNPLEATKEFINSQLANIPNTNDKYQYLNDLLDFIDELEVEPKENSQEE
jgi:hypothetical protein